ncbi:MAG TPA: T9SS type A sorting domain-containing protein [Draconibacterium sp.]|nr:T9SS type A sorting domain-containing protein [Draconibacterium sp.]
MKTLFVGLVATCLVSVAGATGNLKVDMAANETDVTVVEISTNQMVNYEIELFNELGDRVYEMKTEIPRSELKKKYDFSDLENGNYWYYVRTDKEQIRKKLAIEYGNVAVMEIRKTADPYFIRDGDMIKLSYLNFENEPIKLYVYDNYNLLEEVSLGEDLAINKAIDLSKLDRGEYNIVLTNEFNVYEHNVLID